MNRDKPANSLAQATSAYLRSASHQPVEWREWGETAFEQARQQEKPILLDIGAAWCHWCHVMDRESYEDREVARLINEHYVPVKVDRDERPDIDARYQMAVSALTGQGGWPLTVFLTPDGKPFFGGTYFPPDDRHGRPGMKGLLEAIVHTYKTHRDQILDSAEKICEALSGLERFEKNKEKIQPSILEAILENILALYDSRFGGFGRAPKFPYPGALDLLLDAYLATRQAPLLTIITTTLERMGRGGVYDQLAGGFHRYSVDERWVVPHFEKMSYDNAGLLVNYLRAYQVTGNEFFREISLGILSFLENVLSNPEGGFFASQDADSSLEDDGDYFTWTLAEVKAVLDDLETQVVADYYHIEPAGEMHHNPAKNVLFVDQPLEAIAARRGLKIEEVGPILARARHKMLEARAKRPSPFVDKALYASWNGMMISALLEAYKVLGLEGSRDRALLTLDLFLGRAYDPVKGFAHSLVRIPPEAAGPSDNPSFQFPVSSLPAEASAQAGFQFRLSNFDLLDDQVFMAAALLGAWEVTGRRHYFDRALELAETTLRRFWDEQAGSFWDTAKDVNQRQGSLSMPRKPFQDSPTPAGNSAAAQVLDRLASLAERPDFREKAETTLALFASKAGEYGLFAAAYGLALRSHLRPAMEIVVVGARGDELTGKLLRVAYGAPRAGKHVLAFEPETVKKGELPAGLAATLPHLAFDGEPVALVCIGTSCLPPCHTPQALAAAVAENPG
jgi:hypothetical protein